MRSLLVGAIVLALPLVASDPQKVRPREMSSYDARDAHDGITIAAEAYDHEDKIKEAFGNYDLRGHDVLPIYVVFFNPTKDALRLDAMTVTLEHGRDKYQPMPAMDVSRRLVTLKPIKGLKVSKGKGPVSSVVDQELLVKMIPPGETIGGFLYFDKSPEALYDTKLYLNNIHWASSGKELLYFEIPLLSAKTP